MSQPIFEHDDDESADVETASQHSISLDSVGSGQDVTFNSIPLDSATDPTNPVSPPYTLNSAETDDLSIYSGGTGVRENSQTFLVGDWEDDQFSLFDGSERSAKTPSSALFITSPSGVHHSDPSYLVGKVISPLASTHSQLPPLSSSPSVDITPSQLNSRELKPSFQSEETKVYPPPTYPPPTMPPYPNSGRESMRSFASSSSYSKKVRPESTLLRPDGPIILGIALVDFNHLVKALFILYAVPNITIGCRKAPRLNFREVM